MIRHFHHPYIRTTFAQVDFCLSQTHFQTERQVTCWHGRWGCSSVVRHLKSFFFFQSDAVSWPLLCSGILRYDGWLSMYLPPVERAASLFFVCVRFWLKRFFSGREKKKKGPRFAYLFSNFCNNMRWNASTPLLLLYITLKGFFFSRFNNPND